MDYLCATRHLKIKVAHNFIYLIDNMVLNWQNWEVVVKSFSSKNNYEMETEGGGKIGSGIDTLVFSELSQILQSELQGYR